MTRNAYRSGRLAHRVITCCTGLAACCIATAQATPPPELQPAGAQHVVASLDASGVQIYVCRRDQNNHLAWVFKAPQADLYDGSGKLVAKHYAGPTWEATDGSRITGKVLQQMPNSQQPGSIPLLLLQATSAGGPGQLASVRYVQRWNTRGGIAPLHPCTREGQEGRSPYLADYVFLD
ncbi:DUF3455 domain-containing protein [Paraburkholderia gardini]|uniref:DUF3455 domain-containing protein n=1 Tax=Paraburkholderia gardini TaxID=2823469 RepID=A0ABM8U3L8_9BURK|nr:DUF3455 domain-containing protein [Paraburkholderia gardini]CAG4898997.1 hypothetical protein R54767_02471 [Paraburkholderia gardini]